MDPSYPVRNERYDPKQTVREWVQGGNRTYGKAWPYVESAVAEVIDRSRRVAPLVVYDYPLSVDSVSVAQTSRAAEPRSTQFRG
jgi:hypothetical protein